MKTTVWGLFLITFHTYLANASEIPKEISVREAIDLAVAYSPDLKASKARETESQNELGIAKSYYYPTLNAEAIDSTGFPGSNGGLGIEGLMTSPYRKGLSAGLVLKQTIYDFGRTAYGIESADFEAKSQVNQTNIDQYHVEQEVVLAYYNCALNRTQKDTWENLARQSQQISQEVEQFVKTGQRSIVDRYLSQAQAEDANTQSASFIEKEKVAVERLAVLIGQKQPIQCMSLEQLDETTEIKAAHGENPILTFAKNQLSSAEAKLTQAKSEYLPKLVAVGSVGYVADARLVPIQNYAVGAGIEIPLFEGFKIQDTVAREAALVEQRDHQLQATQLTLDNVNLQYDERITSAEVKLKHLKIEEDITTKGFFLARKRYYDFQGTLVDLRDSLKNWTRVLVAVNETRAEYLIVKSLKEILNGGR